MVQLIIYGNKNTLNTQRVLILLNELKLKYEFENVEENTTKALELNPFGDLPIIVYDTRVIFNSHSILRYIAKNNNWNLDLTLNDSYEVDMWLETDSENFNPHKIQENEDERCKLTIYEERLKQTKYIGGESFSIADISHFPYLNYFIIADKKYKTFLKEQYPYVYKWFKRMSLKESIQDVFDNIKNSI